MTDGKKGDASRVGNQVQQLREALLLSKAELARIAGVSALTIDRVEKGNPCRMDTKRKILLALGLKLSDRKKVFFDEDEDTYEEHRDTEGEGEESQSTETAAVQSARDRQREAVQSARDRQREAVQSAQDRQREREEQGEQGSSMRRKVTAVFEQVREKAQGGRNT